MNCDNHADTPAEFFCTDHCKLCCAACKREWVHGKCNFVPITSLDSAADRESSLSYVINNLKKKYHDVEISNKLVDALSERQDLFEASVEEARSKIQATFSEIREMVDKKERSILTELEELVSISKYSDLRVQLVGLASDNNRVSALVESAKTVPADAKEFVTKAKEIKNGSEDIEKLMESAFKKVFEDAKVDFSYKLDEITEHIANFCSIKYTETPLLTNFKAINPRDDKYDLKWNYAKRDNDIATEMTYVVDAKNATHTSEYAKKYEGTACECTVAGLEFGENYIFVLKAKLGELVSPKLADAQGTIRNTHFAPNGTVYCGSDLFCFCGECTKVCGENDTGCQCPYCEDIQCRYLMECDGKCPNGHKMLITQVQPRSSTFLEIGCAICRKGFSPCTGMPYIMNCENCKYFVCTACIPRVYPPRNYGATAGIPAPQFDEVTGTQRWYRSNGTIHCNVGLFNCKSGKCNGICSESVCSCDECVEELQGILSRSGLTCKNGHKLQIKRAIERKSRVFKIACDSCDGIIPMTDCMKNMLILSCPSCDFDLCPKCILKKIPLTSIPPNVCIDSIKYSGNSYSSRVERCAMK